MSGLGNSGRAHPSLAKMRENLINGTIDFQEVPIVDMNPEDIRVRPKTLTFWPRIVRSVSRQS